MTGPQEKPTTLDRIENEWELLFQASRVSPVLHEAVIALRADFDEKLSVESADAWLAHRFHQVCDERDRLRDALTAIRDCAKWYGEGERLQHEVHHALVVEVYAVADMALDGLRAGGKP